MRYPRILFYAINGLGLGHVTRLLAIAGQVRHRSPEAEIVFFTSSEAEDVIYREGFAAFKVPSKSLRQRSSIRPGTYARMVQTVTLNLLSAFHPHVLVVDTFPAGSLQELLPVLRWDSRKVFVFRVQRPDAARSPIVQGPLNLYDLAIIPHAEGTEDVPLPESLNRIWTGPIIVRDKAATLSRGAARERLGLPTSGHVVYVTFGGGGDADMDASLASAVAALARQPLGPGGSAVHLAVACGPLYRGAVARQDGVTPVDHYPMAEMYPAFDAAVSATGYNTAMELLHHGVPTAFVPFARQVDDQDQRACAIEEAGAGIRLPNITTGGLRAAVARLLTPDTARAIREAAQRMVPDSGADRAAEAIVALLP